MRGAFPILSCEEAKAFEAAYFAGNESREWTAMCAAGLAVARGIARDFEEIGPWPQRVRVLVLAGKGHNAGDAFIAAGELRGLRPDIAIEIDVLFALGERGLRPLARRAWNDLEATGAASILRGGSDWAASYDVVIDGVFGFGELRPDALFRVLRPNDPMVVEPRRLSTKEQIGSVFEVDGETWIQTGLNYDLHRVLLAPG